ncbi:hypothetical protein ABPG72_009323 [Tetrahymena utriculariae]
MDKQNILSQEQEDTKSAQNLLTLNLLSKKESDSNSNENQLSSPKTIKEFDKKFCEIQNKQSSLNVNDMVEEDIKEIQKNQIYQTDKKELEEKTNEIKNNQNSQNFKEGQEKVIKETQNQVNSHSMMKELHSDLTLKKKVLSQISKGFIRNRQYQNVMVETYNIKDAQHVIVSYQDQEKKSYLQYLSNLSNLNDASKQLKNNLKSQTQNIHKYIPDLLQQQGYPLIQQEISLKQESNKKKCDINEQPNKLKKKQQICSQNQYLENSGKRTENLNNFNPLSDPNQYDQSQQDGNNYLNADLQQPENIFLKQDKLQEQQQYSNQQGQQNQNNFNQMKQDQKNENNSQIIQRQYLTQLSQNIQEPLKQESQMDNNTKSAHNTYDQQDQSNQDISNQQEIQKNSNQSQIQIKNNIEKQKELTESYAYQIKKMLDQIEEYKQQEVLIHEKQQEQEYFEKNNKNQVQSETFQKQKTEIFEKLNENQFYLCKILVSDNNQTLILGFFKEEKYQIFECLNEKGNPQSPIILSDQESYDQICQIIHNPFNLEIVCLIFQTLQLNFKYIYIEQQNISIFIFKKSDFALIQKKFELLTQFKSGILQLKDYSEINSSTFLDCKQCEKQKTCENYQCFKNIKTRILDFLQNQKYLYCECQDKLIQGLIFQFNQEELIALYINFAYQQIFSFLKSGEVTQQSFSNQKYFNKKAPDQYNQLSSLKQICNLKLIDEYQFKEYLVQNKLDGNNIIIDDLCKRLWDIMKFNTINESEVSETFKKNQEVIISILENKKYYLYKSFISSHQEDVFIGYQEESQDSYSEYVFAIKYNPPSSEISRYLLIQCFSLTPQQL